LQDGVPSETIPEETPNVSQEPLAEPQDGSVPVAEDPDLAIIQKVMALQQTAFSIQVDALCAVFILE